MFLCNEWRLISFPTQVGGNEQCDPQSCLIAALAWLSRTDLYWDTPVAPSCYYPLLTVLAVGAVVYYLLLLFMVSVVLVIMASCLSAGQRFGLALHQPATRTVAPTLEICYHPSHSGFTCSGSQKAWWTTVRAIRRRKSSSQPPAGWLSFVTAFVHLAVRACQVTFLACIR